MGGIHKFLAAVILITSAAALVGCPKDVTVTLNLSSTLLDFDTGQTDLHLIVTKNQTSRQMAPLIATATQPWISINGCATNSDGCVSSGPFDEIDLVVSVDRGKMALGTNTGSIILQSGSAPVKTVEVRAATFAVPDFSVSNSTPTISETITFQNQSLLDLPDDEEFLGYVWDFGTGDTSEEEDPRYAYSAEGVYTVSLTVVTSLRTVTATKESFIIVAGKTPVANFTASTTNASEGDTIAFSDQSVSTFAPITEWSWNFGDGQTATGSHPFHVYSTSGVYTVTLTVDNGFGADSETKTNFIFVNPRVAPTADFAVNSPYSGVQTEFADTSQSGTKPITSWVWSFGDGGTSLLQNPKHIYSHPGTYTVSLTVQSLHGTHTKTSSVVISYFPLTADFRASSLRPLTTDEIQFTDISLHGNIPITEYRWDLGDGTISTEANPRHLYAAPGAYTISLKVTTARDSDTIVKQDYLHIYEPTILDEYVRRADTNYAYTVGSALTSNGIIAYPIQMTSLRWRTSQEVNSSIWRHLLMLIKPTTVESETAILVISGYNNGATGAPPRRYPS